SAISASRSRERCVCASTIAGMTVSPVRSTFVTPAGSVTAAVLPTSPKCLSAPSVNVAFSMTVPSPTISRAPVNAVTFATDADALGAAGAPALFPEQAASATNAAADRPWPKPRAMDRRMVPPPPSHQASTILAQRSCVRRRKSVERVEHACAIRAPPGEDLEGRGRLLHPHCGAVEHTPPLRRRGPQEHGLEREVDDIRHPMPRLEEPGRNRGPGRLRHPERRRIHDAVA